jgi:hypothetical protein
MALGGSKHHGRGRSSIIGLFTRSLLRRRCLEGHLGRLHGWRNHELLSKGIRGLAEPTPHAVSLGRLERLEARGDSLSLVLIPLAGRSCPFSKTVLMRSELLRLPKLFRDILPSLVWCSM